MNKGQGVSAAFLLLKETILDDGETRVNKAHIDLTWDMKRKNIEERRPVYPKWRRVFVLELNENKLEQMISKHAHWGIDVEPWPVSIRAVNQYTEDNVLHPFQAISFRRFIRVNNTQIPEGGGGSPVDWLFRLNCPVQGWLSLFFFLLQLFLWISV